MDDIGARFDEAVTRHEAGRVPEAERLYMAILKTDPEHLGTLRYLGVLRAQQGQPGEALVLLDRALKQDSQSAETHTIQPDIAAAHFNLGKPWTRPSPPPAAPRS